MTEGPWTRAVKNAYQQSMHTVMALPFPQQCAWINARSSALCVEVPQLRDWAHIGVSKVTTKALASLIPF